MFTSIAQLKEFCQRHLVVVALVALMVVEALSLAVLVQPSLPSGILMPSQSVQESVVAEPIQKISEIKGQQIDDEAAMIVVEGSSPAPACATLPIGIWVFLLIAYAALLIFNFSYTFERAIRPQWFLEAVITVLALVAWYAWDECHANVWFPFAIVKFGLIIFALYAYLLEKKLSLEGKEKTESLF